MNNANVTNMKTLVSNYKNDIIALVYNGVDYTKRRAITDLVVNDLGIRTLKGFMKFDFSQWEITNAQLVALEGLQKKLNKYMSKPQPVAKKKKAKKVAKKTKVTLKEKYTKLYKIVSNYSDNLMQDVYSVVYRSKELKRFVNTNLANKFIEQEVLVKLNEHAISTAKKSRALKAELEQEFA